MVAVSRFVEFSATATTFNSATAGTGASNDAGKGTRGYSRATGANASADSFDLVLNDEDQLTVNINGISHTITLISGTDLDPRFVARDIEFKLHSVNPESTIDPAFKFAQCQYRNGGLHSSPNTKNSLIIYSGVVGSGTAGANDVNVSSPGSRDARGELGFDSVTELPGQNFSYNSYTGFVVASGAYGGQFDDTYHIMIAENETIGNATAAGGNTYNGTATAGGLYIGASNNTYTINVDTANGSAMGQGTGNVPTFTVTDTPGSDQNANSIELLYPDHWYDVGASLGVRIKFSDAVFGNGDQFTIAAVTATGTVGGVGSAKYIFDSDLGDSTKIHGISPITTSEVGSQLGTRGVTLMTSASNDLEPGERFTVICRGPQPLTTGVTQLNFGNVTVSTQSSVKVIWFELIGGAVSMSTIKFSLQSDGTFSHHDQGDGDTEFHFGTVGGDNDSPGSGPTSNSQTEFPVTITTSGGAQGKVVAGDIDSNTPPAFLFATQQDLAVVSSADDAEDIGNFQGGLVSDFMYLAIKLGANEVGANSTINYRMFFDFS